MPECFTGVAEAKADEELETVPEEMESVGMLADICRGEDEVEGEIIGDVGNDIDKDEDIDEDESINEDTDEDVLEGIALVVGFVDGFIEVDFEEIEDAFVVEVILEVMSLCTVFVAVLQVGLIDFLVHDAEPVIKYVET